MSDAILIALIATIAPTTIALVGLIQTIITKQKQSETIVKLEQVHILTNRNFSEQKQEIALLRQEIDLLKGTAAAAEAARATLAREALPV
jgi:hypothetical protein